jgi:hypothetical protein
MRQIAYSANDFTNAVGNKKGLQLPPFFVQSVAFISTYQNFHQGFLVATAGLFVAPVAWPVTLSFQVPF